jgi:hypothetical protein
MKIARLRGAGMKKAVLRGNEISKAIGKLDRLREYNSADQ